jgi:hypothetical protein
VLALLLGFGAPLACLVAVRAHEGKGASLSGMSGIWLYGRVAPFANCSTVALPPTERSLCPPGPPGDRPGTPWFENSPYSPARRHLPGRPPPSARALTDFAIDVIKAQPVDYAFAVLGDYLQQFRPDRGAIPGGPTAAPWTFATTPAQRDAFSPPPARFAARYGGGAVHLDRPLARLLRAYQRFGYTPGPVLAVCVLFGLAGLPACRRGPGAAAAQAGLLLTGSGILAVLLAAATVQFTWRYALPTLVLLPPGAGASARALLVRRRGGDSGVGGVST